MRSREKVSEGTSKKARFRHSFIVIGLMVLAIFFVIVVLEEDPQIPLIFGCIVAGLMALYLGFEWEEILEGMLKSIKNSLEAILILLTIGVLMGTWIACGTIPTIIYYGLKIISPSIFLPTVVILSTLVAMATGSWGCLGTIGLSFMGIGGAFGIPLPMVAGAVVSGAYAGEMLSPISDAPNLAAASSRSNVFDIVRGRMKEALISLGITIGILAVMGFRYGGNTGSKVQDSVTALMHSVDSQFVISPITLLPLGVVILCIILKWPAIPSMLSGCVAAFIMAPLLQNIGLKELVHTCYHGFESDSGIETVDALLSAGGIDSMFHCISIVMIAMAFGGIMQSTGQMQAFVSPLVKKINRAGGLNVLTLITGICVNGFLPDQFLSISMPGQMYGEEYRKMRIKNSTMGSTALASAMSSPLIPWNTCGIYCTAVLGVTTLSYMPFAFFCFLTPALTFVSSLFFGNKKADVDMK